MTKEILKPNDEGKSCVVFGVICALVLRHSFDIRHSDFVIFQSHDSNAEFGVRNEKQNGNGQLTPDNEP